MTKEDILHHFQDINFYYNDCMMYDDLSGMLDELIAESKDEWIPVSERLPEEENKRYWICTDCGDQCVCRWTNVNLIWTDIITDWHWHIMDFPQDSKVVAWMPLPEPYKETERGE